MIQIIALDYDDTYTADPELWDLFIVEAKKRKHIVVCVTFRDKEQNGAVELNTIEVFYTSGQKKREYMKKQGFEPSIWIDDMPQLI